MSLPRTLEDRARDGVARSQRTGASGDPLPDESVVRSRLRSFIDTGVLPAEAPELMWSGTCFQAHRCIVCGSSVELGEPEFEWENPVGLPLFFHRRCVALWKRENGANSR